MVQFENMKKSPIAYEEIPYGDDKIKVLKKLSIRDRGDIVDFAVDNSERDGIYHPVLVDFYFTVGVILVATDVFFSPEDRQDYEAIYDTFVSTGLFKAIMNILGKGQEEILVNSITALVDQKLKYTNTAGAVLQRFIQDMPKNAGEAVKILDNLDIDKYSNLLSAAKTNGQK